MIEKIGTSLGIVGAVLVALGKPLSANLVWVVSNPLLIYHNFKIGQLSQSRMFVVFTIISVLGIINLWN